MKEKGFYGLLTAIVVAVLIWAGGKLVGLGEDVSVLIAADKVNVTQHEKILGKMDDMVSRREFDAEILSLKARVAMVEVEIAKIKMK